MADEKRYFREVLGECRAGLPVEWVGAHSQAAQQRLLACEFYRDAAAVILYGAKDHEVQTEVILADALASGRRVLFPRVVPQRSELSLVPISDASELRPGAFGLLEPTGSEIVRVNELGRALICVPGVAFGRAGERLGRGGGFYDRLLACAAPQVIAAGLAYSFQLLDSLPESATDRRVDLIVTEFAIRMTASAPRQWWTDQGGVLRC